jgi:hypothetical protein
MRSRFLLVIPALLIMWVVSSVPTLGQEGRGAGVAAGQGGRGGGTANGEEGRGGRAGGAGRGAAAPTPAGPVPRRPDGKPDFTGSFNGSGGALTHTNIIEEHAGGFGILAGRSLIIDPPDGIIPYQPYALEERNRRRADTNGYEDPASHCESYGMARLHQFNLDFTYSGNFLIIDASIQHVTRFIDMTRREHLPDSIRLWVGDTIASWDGDTLVLETTNFNGRTWMGFGDFHGAEAKIVERYNMADSNTIKWTMTITNPKVFTRPWTITSAGPFTRRRADNKDGEDACHEYNIDLVHLKNVYQQAHGSTRRPNPAIDVKTTDVK